MLRDVLQSLVKCVACAKTHDIIRELFATFSDVIQSNDEELILSCKFDFRKYLLTLSHFLKTVYMSQLQICIQTIRIITSSTLCHIMKQRLIQRINPQISRTFWCRRAVLAQIHLELKLFHPFHKL